MPAETVTGLALFLGAMGGGTAVFPQGDEVRKLGYHLMIDGLATARVDSWVVDLGGGWFYNELSTEKGEKLALSSDGEVLAQRDLEIRSRAGYVSLAARYELAPRWELGVVSRGLLDNSIAFTQDPEDPRVRLFGGISAVYEVPGHLRYRTSVSLVTDLTTPNREIVMLSLGFHVGLGTAVALPAEQDIPIDVSSAPETLAETKEPAVRLVFDGQVLNFDTARWVLEPRFEAFVRDLGIFLVSHSDGWQSLAIEGHTDSRGRLQYNIDLSDKRANTIRKLLEKAGVAGERLRTNGYGPTRLAADPEVTDQDRLRNRRVVLAFDGVTIPEELQSEITRLRLLHEL